MHILIAGTTYAPSANGQAVFTTNLAERLAASGHRVAVIAPSERGTGYATLRHGVSLLKIKSLQLDFWHPDASLAFWPDPAVERFFDRFQPHIVHIQDHYPLSWHIVRLAQQRGLPVVGTNHFVPENVAPYVPQVLRVEPLFRWLMWRWVVQLYNEIDCVTVQSQTAATLLREEKLTTPLVPISCGIDLERFFVDGGVDQQATRRRWGLDANKIVFLYVGRLDSEKRLDVLIRAMQRLNQSDKGVAPSDVQLALAGRGAEMEHLRQLSQAQKLDEQVRFLGYVADADLPALLNSVDLFAMPSEAELLSIATLEAMACGRPILAARARALPELVEDGVNGFLFRPGDPADAARAMAALINAPERWPQMGMASQQRAAAHAWPAVLQTYNHIYHALVARRTTPVEQPSTVSPSPPN